MVQNRSFRGLLTVIRGNESVMLYAQHARTKGKLYLHGRKTARINWNKRPTYSDKGFNRV